MNAAGQGSEIQQKAESSGHATLKRLLLWMEKEAHHAGADVEAEITAILAKLERKSKDPK